MASPTRRVFRSSKTSKAAVMLDENSVSIIGDKRNFIVADDRGITIKGPISLVADSMNIRRGGLFVGMNDFLKMIPSTMVTPIPSQIPFPPVNGLTSLARDVAFFMALLI
jgi:hypothetical protein